MSQKTMSYAVKRQGEIKFLLEGRPSCADFVTDVSRESVPCGRARKRERSLAKFCSKAWHVIQAAVIKVVAVLAMHLQLTVLSTNKIGLQY